MSENNENLVAVEMPRYRAHKEVWALRIVAVQPADGAAILHFENPYAPLRVSKEYVKRHDPKADGYYVRYKDGYESWSPAKAFEEGYTLVDGAMIAGDTPFRVIMEDAMRVSPEAYELLKRAGHLIGQAVKLRHGPVGGNG